MNLALLALFVALAIGDAMITAKGLKLGAEEASPLPRLLFRHVSPVVVMTVMKALATGFLFYALHVRATQLWHEMLRWGVIAALFGGSIYVLISNWRTLHDESA